MPNEFREVAVLMVLLGAPGAGKGTQARLIVEHFRLLHLSTGDLLRKNIHEGTDLGARAAPLMNNGQYVPDDLINAMVEAQLDRPEAACGVIFDGYPRTLQQAEALDDLLRRRGHPLDVTIHLHVDTEVLVARLAGRRVCTGCGAVYHLKTMPPLRPGICDACGSPLVQREDDNEETVRKRMEVYRAQTEPLLDYYRAQRRLREVDASNGVENTFERISRLLEGGGGRSRA